MTVSNRYGARAAEYCEALGSLDQMEPTDIALITSWGASVPGSILDAGCGPRRDQGNISWFHLIERPQRLTVFRRPRPIPAADCHCFLT